MKGLQARTGTGLCFCPSAVSEWERGFLGIAFYLASNSKCLRTWNFASALTLESISGWVFITFPFEVERVDPDRLSTRLRTDQTSTAFSFFYWRIYKLQTKGITAEFKQQQQHCKKIYLSSVLDSDQWHMVLNRVQPELLLHCAHLMHCGSLFCCPGAATSKTWSPISFKASEPQS